MRHGAAKWEIPSDFLTWEHFCRVYDKVDKQSSPGYPYCIHYSTNAAYFAVHDETKNNRQKRMVFELVKRKLNGLDGADPIRVIIKGEPLTHQKLEQGRYRPIASVSVVDQIVDAMLHGSCNMQLKVNNHLTPTRIGWTPLKGGWRQIPAGGWKARDKKHWDWSVKPWILQCELEIRKRLCVNLTEQWSQLAEMRYRQLYHEPLWITSGGLLIKQTRPGKVKSGMYNTISTNCLGQDIVHTATCLDMDLQSIPWIFSMGDDTLQPPFESESVEKEYDKTMSKYCVLKEDVKENEFSGMRFEKDQITPLYLGKHAFQLLHMDDSPEHLAEMSDAYCLFYHRSQYRDWMENMFTAMGYPPLHRSIRDIIFDYSLEI